jgi:ubiquitin-protein ligase
VAVNEAILDEHLKALSNRYVLSVSDDAKWIVVHDFELPAGYSRTSTNVLVEVPRDYPLTPPGVACRICIAPDLRFRGETLRDLYARDVPPWGRWGWLCYRDIRWDPHQDSLLTLIEMLRTDLARPRIRKPKAAS